MNILIDINHPAHVHLLRYVYEELKAHGHTLYVTIKDFPAAKALLESYGIPYVCIGRKDDSMSKKGIDQLLYNWRVWPNMLIRLRMLFCRRIAFNERLNRRYIIAVTMSWRICIRSVFVLTRVCCHPWV